MAGHSPQTCLQPRLHPREPLASSRAGVSPPPVGADKNPLQARANGQPPPARVEQPKPPSKVESQPPWERTSPLGPWEVLPTTPRVEEGQATAVGLTGTRCTCVRPRGGISEPPGPLYLVGMAEERKEAVGHIYNRMAGKQPPEHNIASRALGAYYTRADPQTLSTWACQILCMIAEYHMACVTRGSTVTSPLLPRELAERLPPLADYAPPEDQTGVTDVRVRDNWGRTLRVAVLCHRLDMALRQEPGSSRMLVRSRHRCGDLLVYFLSPGTAWKLHFKDVVTQVLKENRRHLETKRAKVVMSLTNCNRRRTDLHKEFDSMSEVMQLVTDQASRMELEHLLSSLQTSLDAIEWAITHHENTLEDCRMQEEEAHQDEAISQRWEEEEGDADAELEELMEEEERESGEPSEPQGAVETEEVPPGLPLVMLSLLRKMPSSCNRQPHQEIPQQDLTAPVVRLVLSWGKLLN